MGPTTEIFFKNCLKVNICDTLFSVSLSIKFETKNYECLWRQRSYCCEGNSVMVWCFCLLQLPIWSFHSSFSNDSYIIIAFSAEFCTISGDALDSLNSCHRLFGGPAYLSPFNDSAERPRNVGSVPGMLNRLFCSPKRSKLSCCPPIFMFCGFHGLFHWT